MYTQTPGYTSTDTLLPYTTLLRSKYSNFYKSIPNQMSQVPFTPEGVQQKLGELYNLSDAQLLAQAQQLNMNLRPWVEENFELNAAQKKYLSKVPEEILFTWGAQFAAAIANRGTITMEPLPDYSSHQAERSNWNGTTATGEGRTKETQK